MATFQVQLWHVELRARLEHALDEVENTPCEPAVDNAAPYERVLEALCNVRGREF